MMQLSKLGKTLLNYVKFGRPPTFDQTLLSDHEALEETLACTEMYYDELGGGLSHEQDEMVRRHIKEAKHILCYLEGLAESDPKEYLKVARSQYALAKTNLRNAYLVLTGKDRRRI